MVEVRRRNMFYATGLPGWMRFGFSPGWVGRSPSGLGPCAQFLMSGQWPTPQMAAAWQAMQASQPMAPWPGMMGPMGGPGPWGTTQPDAQAQLEWLKGQADLLQQQLEQVQKQIERLEQSK